MRVLVCGGRDFDPMIVSSWLALASTAALGTPITAIVHGDAPGADRGAKDWAARNKVAAYAFPVTKEDWRREGKRAGPSRNTRMLKEGRPDVVVAFPGGRGTRNMVQQARRYGLPVIWALDQDSRLPIAAASIISMASR